MQTAERIVELLEVIDEQRRGRRRGARVLGVISADPWALELAVHLGMRHRTSLPQVLYLDVRGRNTTRFSHIPILGRHLEGYREQERREETSRRVERQATYGIDVLLSPAPARQMVQYHPAAPVQTIGYPSLIGKLSSEYEYVLLDLGGLEHSASALAAACTDQLLVDLGDVPTTTYVNTLHLVKPPEDIRYISWCKDPLGVPWRRAAVRPELPPRWRAGSVPELLAPKNYPEINTFIDSVLASLLPEGHTFPQVTSRRGQNRSVEEWKALYLRREGAWSSERWPKLCAALQRTLRDLSPEDDIEVLIDHLEGRMGTDPGPKLEVLATLLTDTGGLGPGALLDLTEAAALISG